MSGDFQDFAFHTAEEDSPWWLLDLGQAYSLERIVIHNRLSGHVERAKTLKVQVSLDNTNWTLIHAGLTFFGARGAGAPLEFDLKGFVRARYIQVSLAEHQCLHLSQVEVLVRRDSIAFDNFVNAFGLKHLNLQSHDPASSYRIETSPNCADPEKIVGLKINYSGRLGNIFLQYTHAVLLAERTSLKYVQLGRHELFDLRAAVEIDGITYLPYDYPLPDDGAFLSGIFFNSSDLIPVLNPFMVFNAEDEADHARVARDVFRKHLLTNVPFGASPRQDDKLTVHIRSGDIFSNDEPVSSGYRQPPLSFYTTIISKLVDTNTIRQVLLVYEDEGNPCIALLKSWLDRQGIPFTVQSGALAEDLAVLIDAAHLVFGHGTFGYAVSRLSTKVQTLHFFEPELGGRYEYIPGIAEVYQIRDAAGQYIKPGVWHDPIPGDWHNTPDQRALMGTYPAENLTTRQLKPRSPPSPEPDKGLSTQESAEAPGLLDWVGRYAKKASRLARSGVSGRAS